MLTSRGFYFLTPTLVLLGAAVLLGAMPLVLICFTLITWFLVQWFLFLLRVRVTMRRLRVEHALVTSRGSVESVWAEQKMDVMVTLTTDGVLGVPYIVVSERLPALARLHDGSLRTDGALAKGRPLSFAYAIEAKAAGWLRFEGVKVEFADLEGFFTHVTFVREGRAFRVLPTLAVEATQPAFIKQHNALPLLGSHRHARPGSSSELLDLRDYIAGDPPRMIAWKVTARRDRLITREFESEVPIRCTLFLDTSNSVRIGPVGETALCRLVEIAAGIAQANAAERDLTGLCLFDDVAVRDFVKPGRGSKHALRLLGHLTDVAGLIAHAPTATVRELIPHAYGLAQDVFPELLDRDVNWFPGWLPFWSPQPSWTKPPGAPRGSSRLSPAYHREYRRRKQVSAILAVRYDLGAGGLARLLEDDEQCVRYMQRFLAEHQVALPFPLYDHAGRYVCATPAKAQVLAGAILKSITRAKDNELFVLCIDLLEMTEQIASLERAVCVARAKHHQVIAICPWPAGVRPPGTKPKEWSGPFDVQRALAELATDQLHQAYAAVEHALGRFGVPVLCAAQRDAVDWILQRMRRLRIQERGVR
ncbi:MAG TPA: DUF58 domain-containing protein [Gemmataceae bacterium]|nr:DUF58 domain-containing protein [Gemmataceae bacterium]